MRPEAVVIVAARGERAHSIRMLVEAAGLFPMVFAEHDEILSACPEEAPAAVIVDLADPHLRPADLVRRLCTEDATRRVVVIAIGRLEEAGIDESARSFVQEIPGDPLDGAQLLHALFGRLSEAGGPEER